MEEQLRSLAEPAIALLGDLTVWLNDRIFSITSTYQLIAMAAALAVAFMVRRPWRTVMTHLANRGEDASGMLGQALRTLSSISLPVVWALGLWAAMYALRDMGQPVGLIRLALSLINAWVAIRVVTVLIPSAYWSSVFAWCAWTIAAANSVGLLEPAIDVLRDLAITVGGVRISAWTAVKGLVSTAFLVWGAYAVSGYAQTRLERTRSLSPSMRVLVSKLLRYLLIMLAAVAGLNAVGIDLTAFAIFSGAIGVGVGLGMQRTVANLVAGFALLADRSLKPGDVIEIETSQGPTYGVVRTMGARYVAVLARDGTETLIPNELLIVNPVTNWSYSNRRVRRSVPVGVSYATDVEGAMTLCVEAARATPRVLRYPEPVCLIRGFGDSSVDLELRFWIEDPEDGVSNVTSDVFLAVWKSFHAHGIEIPFPQRDVHFRSPIEVRIDGAEPRPPTG